MEDRYIYKTDGLCKSCHCHREAILHWQEAVDGAVHFVWKCCVCGISNPFSGNLFIGKRAVLSWMTQEQMERLPRLSPPYSNPPCDRCGAKQTQRHHWGPKGIVPDPEDWPQSYLCISCHKL